MGEQSLETVDPVARLRDAVREVAAELGGDGTGGSPTLERPPRAELGDYSTNAAMLLAPVLGAPPREIAERLSEPLASRLGADVDRIEIAGPGFLNLFLADRWCRDGVREVLVAGAEFGAGAAVGDRIAVEFVSANPTGPLTAAGGRHAAFGDSVARVLERAGHRVERHYYLNDTGGQVLRFAASIAARMTGGEPPEDGYEGAYVGELAQELAAGGAPGDLDALGRLGTEAMRERIGATLERFGVTFDRWYSERSYQESGKMGAAIAKLREAGHVYESEGATWLRTGEFGDDKDRVLLRSDGEPTYFAADIAYHLEKTEQFDHLINVLGVDHHGYVARMRAALGAAGADPDRFEAPLINLVHIVEAGERAQMSKRKGEFVTLDELVEDIGVDAARWFMVQRSNDTQIDLDLDLARKQSSDNPVYYVQYAHARIASILRKAEAETDWETSPERIARAAEAGLGTTAEPAERALVKRLLAEPSEVRAAAELRAPHRLCAYATETAADFHAFYRDCQVVGAGGELEQARLALCVATKSVIASTLGLLGVSAPERM